MSERHAGYIVTLEEDISGEEAQAVTDAIGMVRFVRSIEPVAGDLSQQLAMGRRDSGWKNALLELVRRGPEG